MNPVTQARAAPKKSRSGFTLLELLIALALVMTVSGGVFLAVRQASYRALTQAAVQLQADIRYAQRRAVIDGEVIEVLFEPAHNRYRLRVAYGFREIRRVYFQNGIELEYASDINNRQLHFHPRGTASSGFRVRLTNGWYSRDLTATVSGGRIEIYDTVVSQ